jgi:predicted phage terminase large subunit-like protein
MATSVAALLTAEALPEADIIDKILSERSLRNFIEAAWHVIEPVNHPFIGGWHIDAICEHLEAVSKGEIRNLVINIPPRCTKSLSVSVMWPAWEWGPHNNPSLRFLTASYAEKLSVRDAVRSRRVIQDGWYQSKWGDRFHMVSDQNAKTRFDNNKGGYRVSTSVTGVGTGEGGDILICDDPNNVQDVESEAAREEVNTWWSESVSTRGNTQKSSKVVIQQRCHPNDLTGHIMATNAEDYEFLILPAEYEGRNRERSTTGWHDPRIKVGELLCPARFPEKEVKRIKRELKDKAPAQLQQRPAPIGGTVFKEEDFKVYQRQPRLDDFIFLCHSWDMAFKNTSGSSFVSGQVWGLTAKRERYWLDELHKRLTFTETCKAVQELADRWPQVVIIFIEDKANGTAVIDTVKDRISGVRGVNPYGSKLDRALAISPDIDDGLVYIPDKRLAPWIEEAMEEIAQFPRGLYTDRVDTMSQALFEMTKWERKRSNLVELPLIRSLTRTNPLSILR